VKSARLLSITVLILGLLLNEWAFKFISASEPIDSFLRLLILVFDSFLLIIFLALCHRNETISERIRSTLQKTPRSTAFYFGLFLCFGLIVFVEFGCRYYFKYFYLAPYSEKTSWKPSAGIPDSIMGSVLPKNTTLEHIYTVNDSLIYQQNYQIDKYGRRITPSTGPDSTYSEFMMVTGCSFAFGYGLSETETLGFYLDSLTSYRAYNYAAPGYGTQQTLALLESRNLNDEINEANGTLVHFFIDDHIPRLIGSRRMMKLWARDYPYYYLDGSELKRNGSFWTGRKLQTRLYRAISQGAFIDLFDIDFPWYVSNSHLELFGAVLEDSKKEFHRQFPDGRFLVAIAPNSELSARVRETLESKDIECLDLSGLLDKEEKQYKLHWTEAHPNNQYYLEVAQEIESHLNSNKLN